MGKIIVDYSQYFMMETPVGIALAGCVLQSRLERGLNVAMQHWISSGSKRTSDFDIPIEQWDAIHCVLLYCITLILISPFY